MSEKKKHTPVVAYPPKDARTIPLWAPFHIKIDENYHFVPKSRLKRFFSYLLKQIVTILAVFYNKLFFGLKIVGREKLQHIKGGMVTICNHVHVLDCSMVVQAISPRNMFIPTIKSNLEIFLLRHVIKTLGGIPIPQTPNALKSFNEHLTELLKRGNVVHVYPEGILYPYYTKGIRRFRRGAFKFAYDADVPVVPMVITFRKSRGWRKLTNRCPLLTLTVLDPIYPDTSHSAREEVNQLMDTCFEAMYDHFDKCSEPMEISKRFP